MSVTGHFPGKRGVFLVGMRCFPGKITIKVAETYHCSGQNSYTGEWNTIFAPGKITRPVSGKPFLLRAKMVGTSRF